MEKKKSNTKRTVRSHHYIERKLRKYLSGILYIYNDRAYLGNKMNLFINDKATLTTNISLSATSNLHPIYRKNHVSYHPWKKFDSGMVKMNQDVM